MSRQLFESIKIPATKLENGEIVVTPNDNYPPEIIEWLDNFVVTRNWNGSVGFKVCKTEDEMNDLDGWSTVRGTEADARVAGIHSARHMVNNSAWQYAKNPPASSVYYGG